MININQCDRPAPMEACLQMSKRLLCDMQLSLPPDWYCPVQSSLLRITESFQNQGVESAGINQSCWL